MKYLLPVLISFFNCIVFAQPKIKVDTNKYDLGEILYGTPLDYDVSITNAGNEPLILSRVSADGGAMAKWNSTPILPGEKGTVQFIYDTKKMGQFTRRLVIDANTEDGPLRILFKGEVIEDHSPICVSVTEIDLGVIEYDSTAEFSFRVKSCDKRPIYFDVGNSVNSEFDLYSLESKCIDSTNNGRNFGNEFEVKGKLINLYGNSGAFFRQIQLFYNHSPDTLLITVKGTFVSKKHVTHREFGSTHYYYSNSCLKEVSYIYSYESQKQFFFEGTNCVRMVEEIDYPEKRIKTTEFVVGKPVH